MSYWSAISSVTYLITKEGWLIGECDECPADLCYVYFPLVTPTVYKVWRVSWASEEALRVSLICLLQVIEYKDAGQPWHSYMQGLQVPGGMDTDKLWSLGLSCILHCHFPLFYQCTHITPRISFTRSLLAPWCCPCHLYVEASLVQVRGWTWGSSGYSVQLGLCSQSFVPRWV